MKRRIKGEIVSIGHVYGDAFTGWHWRGGDYPGQELTMMDQALTLKRVCGWTLTELALISDLAKVAGHDEATWIANRYREWES